MLFFKNNSFIKQKNLILKKYPLKSADIRCGGKSGLISVVLPVYNCEKYLEESISSVLSQTYSNFELIIVDDGSTDSSGKIADNFVEKDDRIRVIHQENQKLPAALNTGFKSAKGEFLTWTSADNRMLSCCLETLYSELIRDRDTDMVFGNMRLIDENGNILKGFGWYEIPLLSGNIILPDNTLNLNTHPNNTIGAAFMYRKGTVSVIGEYDTNFYTLEDYDLFMRMNFTFNIKHIKSKKPIYEYRMHKDSLTSHDKELKITDSRPALMELDKKRRENYQKPLFCYIDGENKELEKAISLKIPRIYSKKTAGNLISRNPDRIIYINIENVPQTLNLETKRFLICKEPIKNIYGYTDLICLDSSKIEKNCGWISLTDNSSLTNYIFHKTKNNY